MTDPELPDSGAVGGGAPNEDGRADKRERDDAVQRAAPRRQIGARTCDEKERDRHDELNDRDRDEDQDATPAALFI